MFRALLFVTLLVATAMADVVHLTTESFGEHVGGEKAALVEFYAPWCGHCKNLAPEWKVAGETFQDGDGITIAAVDATEHPDLASEYGVQGYPTIKYFAAGSKEPEEYMGGRTADTIVEWVNDKVGTRRVVKKVPTNVVDLTTSTFDAVVSDPTKTVFLEFYAPWCGHCKSLAPKYEELATAFAGEADVVIAKIDATEQEELSRRYEVSGFPTLKMVPKGTDRSAIDYQSARELEPMVEFVNEHAGTARTPTGGLSANAGRADHLDAMVAEGPVDQALVDKLAAAGDEAKFYTMIAKKVLAQGEGYLIKEHARLAGMINSDSVSPLKKTSFMMRSNILAAFA
jgi:protein disulfide-isomerase A6